MKKLLLAVLAVLLVFGASACGEQGPKPSQETQGTNPTNISEGMQEETEQTDPTHFYEEVQEGLVIDADVERPDLDFVPKVYEIELAVVSREQLDAFLAERGEKIETVEYDETNKKEGMSDFGCLTDKGSYVSLHSHISELYMGCSLYYSTPSNDWYDSDYVFRYTYDEAALSGWEKYGAEYGNFGNSSVRFLEPKEFSFATAAEAEASVRQTLKELGMEDLILDQTFYLDHETMAQVEADTMAWVAEANAEGIVIGKPDEEGKQREYTPKESWTEEDDCYTFVYRGGADGMPMTRGGLRRETAFYSPTEVIVRVGTEGICLLQASQVWRVKEPVEEPEEIIPAGQALEVVKEKISDVVVEEDRGISRVALGYQYMQDGDRWVMRPVWEVTVVRKDIPVPPITYDEYSYILIDAVTGKEI